MLGCESKLDGEPTCSVFPAHYTVYRKDRNSHGGGVFIAIKDIYPSYPLYPSTANCEIVWASLELQSHKKVLLASFYRPPNSNSEIMDQFCYSVNKVFQDFAPNFPQLLIGGDFNLPGIDWTSYSVLSHKDLQQSTTLIDCILDNCLNQVIKYPTRGQNILDLMFTSNPNLLSNELHAPSLSHDHDAVFLELIFKPRLFKGNDHFTYLYKKADISGLDNELNQTVQEFSTRDPTNFSVDENWLFFSSKLKAAIDKWVPKKQVKSHRRLPWITRQIKRMMRKRERLFKLARSSKRALHWQSYKKYRNFVKREIHLAHSNYVNEVIGGSLKIGDGKAFWNYIKLQRTESIGIPPLQVGDNVFDSNEGKADILNTFNLFSLLKTPQACPSSPQVHTLKFINLS